MSVPILRLPGPAPMSHLSYVWFHSCRLGDTSSRIFGVDRNQPMIRELPVEKPGSGWTVLARERKPNRHRHRQKAYLRAAAIRAIKLDHKLEFSGTREMEGILGRAVRDSPGEGCQSGLAVHRGRNPSRQRRGRLLRSTRLRVSVGRMSPLVAKLRIRRRNEQRSRRFMGA